MDIPSKNSPLRIAVLINQISLVQLKELGQCLKPLAIRPHVVLMKQVLALPVAFYRIREAREAEREILQAAEEELYMASQAIGMLTTPRIIRSVHPFALLRACPEKIDYLIGQIEEKHKALFLSKGCKALSVDNWIATYAPRNLLPKQDSPPPQAHPYLWMAETLFPPLAPKISKRPVDSPSIQCR